MKLMEWKPNMTAEETIRWVDFQSAKNNFGKPEERMKYELSMKLLRAGVGHCREYQIASGGSNYHMNKWMLFIDFVNYLDGISWGMECKAFCDMQSVAHGIGQCLLYKQLGGLSKMFLCFPADQYEFANDELKKTIEAACSSAGIDVCDTRSAAEKILQTGVKSWGDLTGPESFKYNAPPQTALFQFRKEKHFEELKALFLTTNTK